MKHLIFCESSGKSDKKSYFYKHIIGFRERVVGIMEFSLYVFGIMAIECEILSLEINLHMKECNSLMEFHIF